MHAVAWMDADKVFWGHDSRILCLIPPELPTCRQLQGRPGLYSNWALPGRAGHVRQPVCLAGPTPQGPVHSCQSTWSPSLRLVNCTMTSTTGGLPQLSDRRCPATMYQQTHCSTGPHQTFCGPPAQCKLDVRQRCSAPADFCTLPGQLSLIPVQLLDACCEPWMQPLPRPLS